MTAPWASICPLTIDHAITDFESGLESVDNWFRFRAINAQGRVSTHVCVGSDGEVLAFFALKMAAVSTEGYSKGMAKGAEDGVLVAVFLVQMGLAKPLQGKGYGEELLLVALEKCLEVDAASSVGLVVLDAATEKLVPFYQKYGFTRIENQMRMVVKMSTLRKSLAP